MRAVLCVLLGMIGVSGVEAAQSRIVLDKKEQSFVPDPKTCAEKDICDLKNVVFRVEQYVVPPEDAAESHFYGTDFYASHETESLASLTKYSFVQFIRGCVYNSTRNEVGDTETRFSIVRRYMNEEGRVPFRHDDWNIDSVDPDPVYGSKSGIVGDRHYTAEWATHPGSWKPGEDGNFYSDEKPEYPLLYISDNVPLAHVLNGIAQNVSLRFRTCLYKTPDVPVVALSDDINFAEPITCYEWGSSTIYNHQLQVFEHPLEISPVCTRPFTEREKRINNFLNEKIATPEQKEPPLELKE